MLSLIAYLGVWKLGAIPIGNVLVLFVNPVWKLFDLAIGGIQAFIFALLTILYFDVAMSTDHDEERARLESTIDDSRHPHSLHKITSHIKKGEQSNGRHNGSRPSSWPEPWSEAVWLWAEAPSAPPSVTDWPVAQRSPVWPVSPKRRVDCSPSCS